MPGEHRPAFSGRAHPLDDPPSAPQPRREAATSVEREVEFTFRGPESLRRRLRIASATTGRSMKQLYEDALREYLDGHGM